MRNHTWVLWLSETLHNATKSPARLPFCHLQFCGGEIVLLYASLSGPYNVYTTASFGAMNIIFARVEEIIVEMTPGGVVKGMSSPLSERRATTS